MQRSSVNRLYIVQQTPAEVVLTSKVVIKKLKNLAELTSPKLIKTFFIPEISSWKINIMITTEEGRSF